MMPVRLRIRVVLLVLGVTPTVAAAAASPEGQEEAVNQVVELNKKALLAYDALEMETASALLHQALNLCKSHGLEESASAARTHLHLGVVYISGLKFPELGEAEFRAAIAIDAKIQLPTSLVNPEVQAAFDEALWWETAPKDLTKRIPFPTGKEPSTAADLAAGVDRIKHPLVTVATQGKAIEIKAQVPPGMGAAKLVLAYMAQNASDFLAREMSPIERTTGWFHESIPVEATQGAWVAYYIEAQDDEDERLASHGSAETPHQITLLPEGGAHETGAPEAGQSKPKPKAASSRGLWVVVGLGSGGGYHSGSPEMNPRDANGRDLARSGFAASQLMHVAPELGYFHRYNLVLSVQGRFQYVTGTQEIRIDNKKYEPPALAFAGLLKATWLLGKAGSQLQPFVNLQAGAGQIRHTITTPAGASLTGCGPGTTTCKDTVLGGPALFGAGAGLGYLITEDLGLYAAFNLLVGLPNVMVQGDTNVGVMIVK